MGLLYIALNASENSLRYLLLIMGIDETLAFPGIADKRCLNEYRGHLGAQKNVKRGLFDPLALNPAILLIQVLVCALLHMTCQTAGLIDLGVLHELA